MFNNLDIIAFVIAAIMLLGPLAMDTRYDIVDLPRAPSSITSNLGPGVGKAP